MRAQHTPKHTGDSTAEALLDIVTTIQDDGAGDRARRAFANSTVTQENAHILENLVKASEDNHILQQLTAGSRVCGDCKWW